MNIIADPIVKSEIIQGVKDELRKINFLRIQYVCDPNVTVQRRLEPLEAKPTLSDLPEILSKGDVQVRLNGDNKLLYVRNLGNMDAQTIRQEDLFAMAKQDIEKNHDISFCFIVDDKSSYGPYSSAIQSVYQAFTSVRQDMAVQTYGKSFDDLDEDRQYEQIQKCTVKIIEISK